MQPTPAGASSAAVPDTGTPLRIETQASLKPHNSFGLPALARTLVRIGSDADVRQLLAHPQFGLQPKFVLGGGSNLVLTHDLHGVVLKVEV
ncbi:MAG: hypothetical protein RLZZ598_969, partial [Pseudomonadota bacterium]